MSETSEREIDRAFADAIFPQLRGTGDSKLRAEGMRRARQKRAALAEAGYDIVARAPTAKGEDNGTAG